VKKKSEKMRDIMVKYLKPHTYNYKGTKSVTFMQKPMYVTFLCYGTIILLINVANGSVVFIFFLIKIETLLHIGKFLKEKSRNFP